MALVFFFLNNFRFILFAFRVFISSISFSFVLLFVLCLTSFCLIFFFLILINSFLHFKCLDSTPKSSVYLTSRYSSVSYKHMSTLWLSDVPLVVESLKKMSTPVRNRKPTKRALESTSPIIANQLKKKRPPVGTVRIKLYHGELWNCDMDLFLQYRVSTMGDNAAL